MPVRTRSQGVSGSSSGVWHQPMLWKAMGRDATMFCGVFRLPQGHRKDKNNPPWQICFQNVSLCFSVMAEKYCSIVLTSGEHFDQGLMYYSVLPSWNSNASTSCLGKDGRVVLWQSDLSASLFPRALGSIWFAPNYVCGFLLSVQIPGHIILW